MTAEISCGYAAYQDGMSLTALLQRCYDAGPAFLDAGTAAALQPLGGVIPGLAANLKVTAPASGLTVLVAPGYAVVPCFTAGQGSYYFGLMENGVLTVPPNSTGNPRQDYVVAYVADTASSASQASISYLTGTAAPPSLPASSVVLALVTVPNAATSIVAGDITDGRAFCVAPGGILPVPAAPGAPAGPGSQLVWDIATSSLMQATTTAGNPVAYQPTAAVTTVTEQFIVTTHSSGNFPVPPGVFTGRVQLWAAGASGGDGASAAGPGAGGGGCEYAEEPDYVMVPGTEIAWACGGRGGDEGNGGNTTFGTVIAHGGQAGTTGEFTSGGGAGGLGGTGSTATIHYDGGNGGNPDNGSGAGGSSAGPGSAGNDGADGTDAATAATPAVSGGGPGAAGVASGSAGLAPPSGPGGGGSGGTAFGSTEGGSGWQGQIIVTYDAPADSAGFAYEPEGTVWLAYSVPSPHVLAQVSFTADGIQDWEISCHVAQVATENASGPVSVCLCLDGAQVDQIRVKGSGIAYPYETLSADAYTADWTWVTSPSQGTTPSAGTHTAQIVVKGAGANQAAVASPWWLRAGLAGSS
jgi:hypothetical protein